MTFLAIDQGNSRTKFGLFTREGLRETWIIPTDKTADAESLAHGVFAHSIPRDTRIGLCSVVPHFLPAWQQMADDQHLDLTILTGASPTPLSNAYATPETLGPDRIMAAVAAAARVGAPVIPISLGTAIVVDAVSAERSYLGGMIAPGIEAMSVALADKASALRQINWAPPRTSIGQTSDEAQTQGLFYLTIGGVRAMIDATRTALGTRDIPLALTGGWASSLAPYLDHVALVDEFLILHGIALSLQ